MKSIWNLFFKRILITTSLFFLCVVSVQAGWVNETIFADPGGTFTSVYDSLGHPHMLFQGSDKQVYYYHDGSQWIQEIIPYPSQGNTRILLTMDEEPVFCFISPCPGEDYKELRFAIKTSSGWQNELIDKNVGTIEKDSFILDNTGVPYVAYGKSTVPGSTNLLYAYKLGELWQNSTITYGGAIQTPLITINQTGYPDIVYKHHFDFDGTSTRIYHAYHTDTGYYRDHIRQVSSSGKILGLRQNKFNDLFMLYHDPWHGDVLYIGEKKSGQSWVFSKVPQNDQLWNEYSASLEIANNGNPSFGFTKSVYYVLYDSGSYRGGNIYNVLGYYQKIGDHWKNETIQWEPTIKSGSSLPFSKPLSLAFDSINNPHLFYKSPWGIEHAWNVSSPPPTFSAISPSVVTNKDSSPIIITGSGFKSGITASLSKGSKIIQGSNIQVINSGKISCNFDLSDAPLGLFDLNLKNPDLQKTSRNGAFFITEFENSLPTIQWQKTLGGTNEDYSGAIKNTSDGGYVLCGSTLSYDKDVTGRNSAKYPELDVWISKLSSNNQIEWQRSFGGSNQDRAVDIVQTEDGGYAAIANSQSIDGDVSGNHGSGDIWVIKLDSLGNLQWQKCLGGSGVEYGRSIQRSADGGLLITGETSSTDDGGDVSGNHGGSDAWIVKLSPLSDSTPPTIEWQRCLGGSSTDYGVRTLENGDGTYLFAGTSLSSDGDLSGNSDYMGYWIAILDSNRNIVRQARYGGTKGAVSTDLIQTSDGGYVVTGTTTSSDGNVTEKHGGSNSDIWVVKFNKQLALEWQKCLGGSATEGTPNIFEINPGQYLLLGTTQSVDGDVMGNHGSQDIWIVKINDDRTILWQKCLGSSDYDSNGYGFVRRSSGDVLMSGHTLATNGVPDIWLFQLEKTNALTINSITPEKAPNTTHISFRINGSGFLDSPLPIVNLTKSEINITATNIAVPDSGNITGRFDLTGARTGTYDLIVKNGDGQTATMSGAFEVTGTGSSVNPKLVTESAVVSGTSAVLCGNITNAVPGVDYPVSFWYEGGATPKTKVGLSIVNQTHTAYRFILTGLSPGTTYHYRAVHRDSAGPENPHTIDADNVESFVTGGGPSPTITSINPSTAPNTGSVQFRIVGSNFLSTPLPVVNLTRAIPVPNPTWKASGANQAAGQTVNANAIITITATDVAVPDSGSITGRFDLTGARTGTYNLVVKNGDGQTATKSRAFVVTDPSVNPKLVTDKAVVSGTSAVLCGNITNAEPGVDYPVSFRYEGGATPKTKVGLSIVNQTHTAYRFILTGLSPGTTYSYRAVHRDSAGPENPHTIDADNVESFRIGDDCPLPPPKLTSPGLINEPGEIIKTLTPEFKWEPVDGASQYGLYISKYPYGKDNIVFDSVFQGYTITGTSFSFDDGRKFLQEGVKYRWNMNSYSDTCGWNTDANTGFSIQRYFTINLDPTITSINPSTAPNTGSVQFRIVGSNFQSTPLPIVNLAKTFGDGQVSIMATNVAVPDSGSITGRFDLIGARTGTYDLIVKNGDGQIATKSGAFEVTGQSSSVIVNSIEPSTSSNDDIYGFIIRGAGFTEESLVTIARPGTAITRSCLYGGPDTISVVYHLQGVPAGIYNVTVTNPDGTFGKMENALTIEDKPSKPLDSKFIASVASGQVPLEVTFYDQSDGNPRSWLWEFGDGTISNQKNPTHTYANTGYYTVNLTVSDGTTSRKLSQPDYIVGTPDDTGDMLKINSAVSYAAGTINTDYYGSSLTFINDVYQNGSGYAFDSPIENFEQVKELFKRANRDQTLIPPKGSIAMYQSGDMAFALSEGDGNVIGCDRNQKIIRRGYNPDPEGYIGWAFPIISAPTVLYPINNTEVTSDFEMTWKHPIWSNQTDISHYEIQIQEVLLNSDENIALAQNTFTARVNYPANTYQVSLIGGKGFSLNINTCYYNGFKSKDVLKQFTTTKKSPRLYPVFKYNYKLVQPYFELLENEKINIGLGNPNDMYYLIEAYEIDINGIETPLVLNKPIIFPQSPREFVYSPDVTKKLKIVINNNFPENEYIRNLVIADIFCRLFFAEPLSPETLIKETFDNVIKRIASIYNFDLGLKAIKVFESLCKGELDKAGEKVLSIFGSLIKDKAFLTLLGKSTLWSPNPLSIVAKVALASGPLDSLYKGINYEKNLKEVIWIHFVSSDEISNPPEPICSSIKILEKTPYYARQQIPIEITLFNPNDKTVFLNNIIFEGEIMTGLNSFFEKRSLFSKCLSIDKIQEVSIKAGESKKLYQDVVLPYPGDYKLRPIYQDIIGKKKNFKDNFKIIQEITIKDVSFSENEQTIRFPAQNNVCFQIDNKKSGFVSGEIIREIPHSSIYPGSISIFNPEKVPYICLQNSYSYKDNAHLNLTKKDTSDYDFNLFYNDYIEFKENSFFVINKTSTDINSFSLLPYIRYDSYLTEFKVNWNKSHNNDIEVGYDLNGDGIIDTYSSFKQHLFGDSVSPKDKSVGVPLNPYINWTLFSENNILDQSLQLFENKEFFYIKIPIQSNNSLKNYSHQIGPLRTNTTYYWNIVVNISGFQFESPIRSFSTIDENSFIITATASPNGTITPSGLVSVPEGADQLFTITPNPGYSIEDVMVDGSSYGPLSSYLFTNVTSDHTIFARFTSIPKTTYTINATTSPNGNINPSGLVSVPEGADQLFTITPDPGYSIEDIMVDGASCGPVKTYTFTNVTANHTISASFTSIPKQLLHPLPRLHRSHPIYPST